MKQPMPVPTNCYWRKHRNTGKILLPQRQFCGNSCQKGKWAIISDGSIPYMAKYLILFV